jgi:MoaA/NifB/PqqE/SkfB family radical SAM enzyme
MLPPKILKLELTNACNLNCVYCQHSKMGRSIATMPKDLAIQVVQDAVVWCISEIQPQFYGESTLCPWLDDVLQEARYWEVQTSIYTNGTQPVHHLHLDNVTFSVDAHTQDLADKIRPGTDMDVSIRHIRLAVRKFGNKRVKVRICRCKENNAYIWDIHKFWSQWCNTQVNDESPIRRQGAKFPVDDDFDCPLMWEQVVVLANGDVALCCCDWDGEHRGGNVKDGLEKAYNHPDLIKARKQIANHRWLPMCDFCQARHSG